mmetsp:Transcript_7273/g.10865  ORF Transcript_7273/g.10865 Transcript_7273/m.10865 type:complete len:473 (-) Transcript_7273:107-1525(-)
MPGDMKFVGRSILERLGVGDSGDVSTLGRAASAAKRSKRRGYVGPSEGCSLAAIDTDSTGQPLVLGLQAALAKAKTQLRANKKRWLKAKECVAKYVAKYKRLQDEYDLLHQVNEDVNFNFQVVEEKLSDAETLVRALQMQLDDAHRELEHLRGASSAAVDNASDANDVAEDQMNADNNGVVDDSNSQEYVDRDDVKKVSVDTKTRLSDGMKLRSRKRINYSESGQKSIITSGYSVCDFEEESGEEDLNIMIDDNDCFGYNSRKTRSSSRRKRNRKLIASADHQVDSIGARVAYKGRRKTSEKLEELLGGEEKRVLKFGHTGMWAKKARELKKFREKNGHCYVPCRGKQSSLGLWVSDQRKCYKKMKAGEASPMTPERVKILTLMRFEWVALLNKEVWMQRLDERKEYKKEHGDCLVPKMYKSNPQLGRWVNTQRTHYWYMKRRKYSAMTNERKLQLEAVEFEWRTKRARPRR